uniref:Uncharacterized protein n=1 Tax=Anguilla anguilla TaxID=7936 RepID=A0A0E9T8F3_ANGAN
MLISQVWTGSPVVTQTVVMWSRGLNPSSL